MSIDNRPATVTPTQWRGVMQLSAALTTEAGWSPEPDYAAVLAACGYVDYRVRGGSRHSLLLHGAYYGRADLVELALSYGADGSFLPCSANDVGAIPLFIAAQRGDVAVGRKLLAAGAAVDCTAMQGMTPLMCAAMWSKPVFMELLVAHGADVNAYDADHTVLGTAVDYSCVAGVKLLLAKGADPNMCPHAYATPPVWIAVREGQCQILKLLLEAGACPNVREAFAETAMPLDLAIRERRTDMALLLRTHGGQRSVDLREESISNAGAVE